MVRSADALFVAAVLLIAAGPSFAQSPSPPNVREACRSSMMQLCHDQVAARDRAGVRACLIQNFDKTTPDCQAAMKAAQAAMAAKQSDAAPTPKP
jgi:hypothetical protein